MSCSEGLGTILTLYYISKFCLNMIVRLQCWSLFLQTPSMSILWEQPKI